MKQTIKDIIAGTLAGLLLAIFLFCGVTEAATRSGWIKQDGDTYYIHKTQSYAYKAGEPTKSAYRWRNGKLYYFGASGKMQKHSSKYIKLNKDDSVKFVYTPGTNHCERYNVKLRRYQRLTKRCRWKSVGIQCNVWWMCDWQE